MAPTPTPSQKYDRQLRIWGEHGQSLLSASRVCLLNAGPTGSEALKNLVLGGIGEFTVVDGTRVEAADLGNNFLVDYEGLGKPKARVVCDLLQELNDGVTAKFVEEDPEALISGNPQFFSKFTLVVATQMREASAVRLDDICRGLGIQLIVARSCGLVGLVRISAPEHCVVESKPDNALDDLRLHRPWPQLQLLAEGYDLDIDDAGIHSHTPFVVILLKALAEWNHRTAPPPGSASGAPSSELRIPKTPQEKAAFKEVITSHRRALDEENYKEALQAAFKVWAPPGLESDLRGILEDVAADVMPSSSDFWIMVSALKGFIENEGAGDVPLEGSIPDMHSFTESYVALQKVYRAKADADLAAVESRVQQTLKSLRGEPTAIPRHAIKQFCKNARNLRVIRYKSLREEYEGKAAAAELQRVMTGAEDPSHAGALYLLLRAADKFEQQYHRLPGSFEGEVDEEDVSRLKALLQGLVQQEGMSPSSRAAAGVEGASLDPEVGKLVAEFCRAGASEIHCVAAVIGGIASQEAIKLITQQFNPLSGTFIYNAMSSTSAVLSL